MRPSKTTGISLTTLTDKSLATENTSRIPSWNLAWPPSRPFGSHSHMSSAESISSIVDEKRNSLPDKAIESVSSLAWHLIYYSTVARFSLRTRTVVRLPTLLPNFKVSTLLTRNMSCPSRSFGRRAREPSSTRSRRISSQAPPVSGPHGAILFGEHPPASIAPAHLVRIYTCQG